MGATLSHEDSKRRARGDPTADHLLTSTCTNLPACTTAPIRRTDGDRQVFAMLFAVKLVSILEEDLKKVSDETPEILVASLQSSFIP